MTAQNKYSWLERGAEDELIPECERLGVALIPYFPLASGLLTGKYHRGAPEPEGTRLSGRLEVSDEQWGRIEALESFAAARELSLLDDRDRRPRRPAGRLLGDRGRDEPGAGAGERSGGSVGAVRRGARRASFALSSDQWEAMAPRWERGRELLWRSTAPVSHWLVHRLAPQQGQTILELSAGLGETGFLAAPLLGPRGLLISSDREPGMVEAAARLGSERGVANAEFRRLEAERIQLPGCERRRSPEPVRLHPQGRPAAGTRRDPPRAAPRRPARLLGLGGAGTQCVDDGAGGCARRARPSRPAVRDRAASLRPPKRRFDRRRASQTPASATPRSRRCRSPTGFKDAEELWFFVSELRGPVALALAELPEAERAEIRAEIESRAAAGDGYELGGVSLNVAVA